MAVQILLKIISKPATIFPISPLNIGKSKLLKNLPGCTAQFFTP